MLDAQRPYLNSLNSLDSWDAWEGWRRAVLDHYGSQEHWGCPVSALAREVIGNDPGYLQVGLERMRSAGILRPDADPEKLALSTFTALQGGLLLTQTMQSLEPLDAAFDGALAALRAVAA